MARLRKMQASRTTRIRPQMTTRPPLRIPHPDELALPLRDLMRVMQQAARIPMAIAQPVVSHLPGPLRDTLSQLGQRAETVYKDSLTIWRPKAAEIRLAAAKLSDANATDHAVTGRVVAWVMEVALGQEGGPEFFISETVVTFALDEALAQQPPSAAPAERAASCIIALVAHGLGPSAQEFPIARMTPQRTAQLRVAGFAAMLYLLAERAENEADEMRILSYAITISELIAAEIQDTDDATALAGLLRTHAEMI